MTTDQADVSAAPLPIGVAQRWRGTLCTVAGVAVAFLSLGWWSERGRREVISGSADDQVGTEYEVLAPFWPGVVVGALVVGVGVALLVKSKAFSRLLTIVLGVGLSVVGGAWLVTFVRLAELGSWVDGRPLRSRSGTIALPPVAGQPAAAAVDYWCEAARHEASSAAAFTTLAEQLASMDAPAHLVAQAQSAILDERRHTDICLGIAESLQGDSVGGPDPEWQPPSSSKTSLARLAVEAFVHGAVGEGFAVERLVIGARTATSEQAALMRELVEDERDHMRLAYDTIEWCVAVGGRNVRWALRLAAATLPTSPDFPELLRDLTEAELHRAGLLSESQAHEVWALVVVEARQHLTHLSQPKPTLTA